MAVTMTVRCVVSDVLNVVFLDGPLLARMTV